MTRQTRRVFRLGANAAPLAALAGAIALALTTAVLASGGAGPATSGESFVAPASNLTKQPRASKPRPTSTLTGTGIIRWGNSYVKASGYERFSYVLVGRQDAAVAARLPGISLVYMQGTTVYSRWSTGVSYQEALANDWLLKDANGAYVTNARYAGFVGDIGDGGYQRRFISNVAAFLKQHRNDGVFIDDVLATPVGLNGSFPARYPTQQQWEDATLSFIATVGAALRAKGYYVLVNAAAYIPDDAASNTGENYAAFYKRLAPHVDGIMNEYWMQNPVDVAQMRSLGSNWYEYWDGWQALVSVTQAAGVDFFGLTYGSGNDTRAMRYGRASFLLDWNGRGGAFMWDMTDRDDPYHPVAVKQLGLPVRPKFERMPGVWQRRYERGIVILNATTDAVVVRVNGESRTIGPTEALFAGIRRR